MKTIDLSAIEFRPSLFDKATTIKDFHKQLANAIWQNKEIAAGKFALALFDNPVVELTEDNKKYITEALENFLQWVKAPVLEAMASNS